jgi:anti-sigma B factor antagonist
MTAGRSSDHNTDVSYEIVREHGCAVLVLTGEIDMYSAPTLSDALAAAAVIADRVVVDMAAVRFIDSSGVGALLTARRDGPVALVRPPRVLRRLLDVTGLGDRLAVFASRHEAARALQDPETQVQRGHA